MTDGALGALTVGRNTTDTGYDSSSGSEVGDPVPVGSSDGTESTSVVASSDDFTTLRVKMIKAKTCPFQSMGFSEYDLLVIAERALCQMFGPNMLYTRAWNEYLLSAASSGYPAVDVPFERDLMKEYSGLVRLVGQNAVGAGGFTKPGAAPVVGIDGTLIRKQGLLRIMSGLDMSERADTFSDALVEFVWTAPVTGKVEDKHFTHMPLDMFLAWARRSEMSVRCAFGEDSSGFLATDPGAAFGNGEADTMKLWFAMLGTLLVYAQEGRIKGHLWLP